VEVREERDRLHIGIQDKEGDMAESKDFDPTRTPYMQYDTLSRWPMLSLEETSEFFIVLQRIVPHPGRQWVPVLRVTDIADRLLLNQGQIQGGQVVFGPGEAFARVGSEGRYAYVRLKDGSESTRIMEELAVHILIPKKG